MFWISFNSMIPLQYPDKVSKIYSMMMSFNGTGRILGPLIGAFLFYYTGYFLMFLVFSILIGITVPIVYCQFLKNYKVTFYESTSEKSRPEKESFIEEKNEKKNSILENEEVLNRSKSI